MGTAGARLEPEAQVRVQSGRRLPPSRSAMSINTIIVIVLLVFLFGGGGFYWSRRR
jgi:hypothetical protein